MRLTRGIISFFLISTMVFPGNVFAETTTENDSVKIAEIQTTGENGETDKEFIELVNIGNLVVDITDWKIQYSSSAGINWQTKVIFDGYFYPGARLLVSSTGYLTDNSDGEFSPGMKMEAGHLRIVKSSGLGEETDNVVDLVGWGAAVKPELKSAEYHMPGMSISRKTKDGLVLDTNNNFEDFETTLPSPESTNGAMQPEDSVSEIIEDPEHNNLQDEVEIEQNFNDEITETVYYQILITELLPNPAPPETDTDDEYIEIFNPNNEPVELKDYKIQTGNNFTYDYIFDDIAIEPGSYMTIYSKDSGLVLSNTSGKARILNPLGEVLYTTDDYEDAKDGRSWSLIDGVWQWSIMPTPNIDNLLVLPSVLSATGASDNKAPKPKKKKATTKKPKATKKSSKKSSKTKKLANNEDGGNPVVAGSSDDEDGSGFSPKSWMIAVVGLIAVGYLVYEYKDDIRNKYLQFRRNRKIGGGARSVT